MVKILTLLLMYILLLSSCQTSRKDADYLVREADMHECGAVELSGLLQTFDLIPLETNNDCLIGNIQSVKKRLGRFYIHTKNELHVFEGNGKHVAKVGNLGEGPGEYQAICDFDADQERIYILTPNKLLYYDRDGKFQKSVSVDLVWGKLRRIEGGFLGSSNKALPDGNGLAYLDDDGNILKTALPLKQQNRPSLRLDWPEWQAGCYIHQLSRSNDLYCFDARSEEFRPIHVVDWDEALSADEYEDEAKGRQSRRDIEGISFMGFTASTSQLLWGVMKDRDVFYCVYDKGTGVAYTFSLFKIKDDITFATSPDEMMMLGSLPYNDSDEDCFISYAEANRLKEAAAKVKPELRAAYGKLKNLSDDANPVIVSFRFKTID